DPDLIVPDPSRSIRGGAVEPWNHALEKQGGWTYRMIESLASSFRVPLDKPWKDLPREVKDLLLYGSGDETMSIRWSEGGRTGTYKTSFEGIIPMLMRRFKETVSESMRKHYLRYFSDKPCSACKGERLRPESRAVTIGDVGETPGKSIAQASRMTIEQAMQLISTLPLEGNDKVVASELLKEIGNRLRFLLDVGLGYLTLDRPGPTLSGGESQRIRLASQMGSELTGVIYILDEPSIGLHQRDNARLLATLKRLRDLGNSVIVGGDDGGGRLDRRLRPGSGRAGRRDRRRGAAPADHAGRAIPHGRIPVRPAAHRSAVLTAAGQREEPAPDGGGRQQPEGSRHRVPA